jgi:hypothetical protein
MNRRPRPDRNRAIELLSYNRETGEFIHAISHHKAKKGKIAGFIRKDGYKSVSIDGQSYLGHHIAWLIVYNEWLQEIDHKDGIRANNVIDNLRDSTRSQNCGNSNGWGKKKPSGLPRGVYYHPGDPTRFRAQIYINYKAIHLGCFDSIHEAKQAYDQAAREHFGDFIRMPQ